MRILACTLTGLLLGATCLLAQQPQPVAQPMPPQQPADPKLEAALASWEKAMTAITSFHIDCSRINVDKAFAVTEEFTGVARFQKPNKALLYLAHKTKAGKFEKFVVNGSVAYQWEPDSKVVRIYKNDPDPMESRRHQ